jgi:hypothetical protein
LAFRLLALILALNELIRLFVDFPGYSTLTV